MNPPNQQNSRLVPFSELLGLARTVPQMRQAQAEYFEAAKRSPTSDRSELFRACRNWERQVDTRVRAIIIAIEFSTPSMFGDENGPGVTAGELLRFLERAHQYIANGIEVGRIRPATFAGDPASTFPEELAEFLNRAKGGVR